MRRKDSFVSVCLIHSILPVSTICILNVKIFQPSWKSRCIRPFYVSNTSLVLLHHLVYGNLRKSAMFLPSLKQRQFLKPISSVWVILVSGTASYHSQLSLIFLHLGLALYGDELTGCLLSSISLIKCLLLLCDRGEHPTLIEIWLTRCWTRHDIRIKNLIGGLFLASLALNAMEGCFGLFCRAIFSVFSLWRACIIRREFQINFNREIEMMYISLRGP